MLFAASEIIFAVGKHLFYLHMKHPWRQTGTQQHNYKLRKSEIFITSGVNPGKEKPKPRFGGIFAFRKNHDKTKEQFISRLQNYNRMKRLTYIAVVLATVVFAATSCTHSSKEKITFEKGENGLLYKFHTKSGDTTHPKLNNLVFVNLRYYLPDTVLFDSKDLKEELKFPMIKPMFRGDLYEGLKIMSPGDSMTIKVVADSFFMKTAMMKKLPDFVKPGTPMYFDVKLKKIQTQKAYDAEKRFEEQKKLDDYIKKNKITQVPTASGLYFIPIKKGHGRKPVKGDICGVYLKVQTLDGTVLWDRTDEMIDIEYGGSFDTKGLMEGLGLMHEGGKARLIVPSPIGVGATGRPPAVEPYTTIIYDVTLAKFKTLDELKKERKEKALKKAIEKQKKEAEETAKIKNWVRSHNYKATPDSNGIYHIVLKEGDGPYPTDSSLMKVYYKLTDMEGNVLQDNHGDKAPFTFKMGTHSVIRGWEKGLKKMRKGEKALIIVPSKWAYGDRGRGNQIKPYTTLFFEVDLADVQ